MNNPFWQKVQYSLIIKKKQEEYSVTLSNPDINPGKQVLQV